MRFSLFSWLLLLSGLSILLHVSDILVYGQCLEDQLLIKLKQSLFIPPPAAVASATSRLTSWNSNTDCCSSWDGVTCDEVGHVIGLDLSSESISGGIDNSSSLFELRFIQMLNLSHNNFKSAPIPNGFDRLVNLNNLNLSSSGFSGQIPMEISRLTRLVSLDLSSLFVEWTPLKLEVPDLSTLVRNMSELRELLLDGVNISAQVPEFFANFSNLTVLHLSSCDLRGKFPEKIFQLPRLQTLDLSINPLLHGWLPDVPQNGSLQNLVLTGTNFSGKLPDSIGNLRNLSKLELGTCRFNGSIPPSMENLTKLLYLDFSLNCFSGPIPSLSSSENLTQINLAHNRLNGSISSSHWDKLRKLVSLNLRNNSLNGSIPAALFTLPSLQRLDLAHNQFSGQLGEILNGSSSPLNTLDFSSNKLGGPVPSSIFDISSLKIFTLSSNNFSGTLGLDMFQKFRNLSSLDLSGNNLSINTDRTSSSLFPQVGTLKLGSCNLRVFPDFLSYQFKLTVLDLSNNQIQGKIPNWIWKIGNGTLAHLNLSHNSLENPEQPVPSPRLKSLAVVDLHSNMLQGQIPILPPLATYLDYSDNNFNSIIPTEIGTYLNFTFFFSLSRNNLIGEIPPSLCIAEGYLQVLDLSYNNLNGSIPPCLGGIKTLRVLNLRENNFHGPMPQKFPEGCSLRTLDLNRNRLESEMSRALVNCTMLEVLDLGNNQLNGTFPSWLGDLSQLRVLVLRSNKFHGPIGPPETNLSFPMLQIIDLSGNRFSGNLSVEYLSLKEMMIQEEEAQSRYKHQIFLRFGFLELSQLYYQDAVTVTYKGLEIEIVKILTIFSSIDLSDNMFEGTIPEAIGDLSSLYALNLSHNALTGPIPPSLGNLSQLESLDLSQNRLNGKIPMQLAGLTFLAVLDLSSNQLVGLIPTGTQFQTFTNASFEGNDGLCGPPLSKDCSESPKRSPSTTSGRTDLERTSAFDLQFIVIGLGFGAGMGMVISSLLFWTKGRKWFDKHTKRMFFMILPSEGLNYKICIDGRIEAEENTEDEPAAIIRDYNETEEDEEEQQHGRFCVFCTKLDISRKRAIHNINCTCHISPLNSSFL